MSTVYIGLHKGCITALRELMKDWFVCPLIISFVCKILVLDLCLLKVALVNFNRM